MYDGVVAAHFDHRMRDESRLDAEWVRGLCRSWGIPLSSGFADRVPRSEEEARDARYEFLEVVRTAVHAQWILTAHHADDQAETVLFRVLRGTGIRGLAGIPAARAPGVARPMLSIWREELEAYADSVGLTHRCDDSNADLLFARNVIRSQLLPVAESHVAAGARRSLVRLASTAAANEAAWAEVVPRLLEDVDVSGPGEGEYPTLSWQRDAFLGFGVPLRGRLIRALAARVGGGLNDIGTRLAVDFTTAAQSGRSIELGDGLVLRRELGRLSLGRTGPMQVDQPLVIPSTEAGCGRAILGGRSVEAWWGGVATEAALEGGDDDGDVCESCFRIGQLAFPLVLRGREPGDRVSLPVGTRKVKKLLLEARIPESERSRVPVLTDALGRVLWIPGVARTNEVGDEEARGSMIIRIRG